MSFELITLRFYHGGVMKIGKKGYMGKPYHGGGVYEFLDIYIDRSTVMLEIKSDYDTILIAECLSHHGDILDCFVCHFVANPVLVPPSLNMGKVHSFTAPNTPPPTHQTPTPIHPSTDPTLDRVHPSSDPIPDPVHPPNEQDSDREPLNWGFNGSDVYDELRSFREERRPDHGYDESIGGNRNHLEGKLVDPDAFSNDEEKVQQRGRVKPRKRKKVNRVVFDVSSQKIVWELSLIFDSVNEFRFVVTKYVVAEHIVDHLYYHPERWSKFYFNFTSKCDVVDNNMAECFNSWILASKA
ncbi:hypothetical protein H5410_037981 [Solanum commersonii]|uniref:Transposase MuDR plant domain-containing protein n=1 Tax=Solanum commersonii TaxID=4109 RepID=A0A9J5Y9F7_SOLCO|nr:hypothetical protein H5410_037981 [Solanum commersonii]